MASMSMDDSSSAGGQVSLDTFRVRLLPSEACFPADALTTVWQAARDAGLRLPSSCRNGTCRTCLSRVVQGTVVYHIDWPGVSREERAEGWCLPCVAYPESDLLIEAALQPDEGSRA